MYYDRTDVVPFSDPNETEVLLYVREIGDLVVFNKLKNKYRSATDEEVEEIWGALRVAWDLPYIYEHESPYTENRVNA